MLGLSIEAKKMGEGEATKLEARDYSRYKTIAYTTIELSQGRVLQKGLLLMVVEISRPSSAPCIAGSIANRLQSSSQIFLNLASR